MQIEDGTPAGMSVCQFCSAVNPYWHQPGCGEMRCYPTARHEAGCTWIDPANDSPNQCPF
jgi:hypothetical protein